jgi:hypothetical protein
MKARTDTHALDAAQAARQDLYRDLSRRNERRARFARTTATLRDSASRERWFALTSDGFKRTRRDDSDVR